MRGIYRIKSKKTNMVYIGESMNIERRWEEHVEMLNNNNHHSYKLQKAWNEEGIESFEFVVLEEIEKEIKNFIALYYLVILEDKYIKEYDSMDKGFNCEYTLDKILKGEKSICHKSKDARIIESIIDKINKGEKLYKIINKDKNNKKQKEKRPQAKSNKIICVDTGVIYENEDEVIEKCGINHVIFLRKALKKKDGGKVTVKSGGWLTFKYI